MDIADAIYAAAQWGDPSLSALSGASRVTPSDKRIAATLQAVKGFLDNCPDDITVMELRRELEELD